VPLAAASIQDLLHARHVYHPTARAAPRSTRFALDTLAGRLVQLSAPDPGDATAVLTVATRLVLEAQRAAEPVAWIGNQGVAHPRDLAENGVDLDALVLIRPGADAGLAGVLRVADRLLRSGAFGLVLLDLTASGEGVRAERGSLPGERSGARNMRPLTLPLAAQTRLASLAQRHDAVLLCLTSRQGAQKRPGVPGSLGSLVSLHAVAVRLRDTGFDCEVQVLKDKRQGPGWIHREEAFVGPPGLR